MTNKTNRARDILQLNSKVELLKLQLAGTNPKSRSVENKINGLQEAINNLEDSHFRYLVDEKDEDVKRVAVDEYNTAVIAADDVLFEAKERFDILVAAETMTITPDQEDEITQERLNEITRSLKERVMRIQSNLDSLVNPNKGQLDQLHDMIAEVRRDGPVVINRSLCGADHLDSPGLLLDIGC